MYASLMGTFDLPAPINYIGSTSLGKSIAMVVDSCRSRVPQLQEKLPFWRIDSMAKMKR